MIPVSEPYFKGNELKYVSDCIKSNWISSIGKYVTQFEEMFTHFCGTSYAISAVNGTAALHLALSALDIKKDDEVLVPDLTFVATANAVAYCGAKPIFVDVDPYTWNIDPTKLKEKITERTKAVIVVHLYGHPCNMDAIMTLAKQYNLKVIEDAAEAHGAKYKNIPVGSIGDIGVFSFYGNKIITTGEGGMITTNNTDLANKTRMLRDHAMDSKKRYWHNCVGYNYRLTNIQAAIGVAQMEHIEEFIEIKRRNAYCYNSLLKDTKGITLPPEEKNCKNVYWMYSILIEEEFGISRDEVMVLLSKEGIDTRPFFYPLHSLPMYKTNTKFPVAENLSLKGLNLPSAATLTEENINFICSKLKSLTTSNH